MPRTLLVAAAAAALLIAPAAAGAAQPTMPLAQVQAGMRCTAASVLQGTQVRTFDAEVLDVLRAEPVEQARILLRFSGPAIAETGVGPGFSGSPVTCPDAAGTPRVVGAISESVGDFGGDVALASPIEAILAEPAVPGAGQDAPASRRLAPEVRRRFPSARAIATPFTVTGLSAPVGRALQEASRRARRPLLALPHRARRAQAPVPLVPGAAVTAALASGDVGLGALGTLTYVDEDRFWAFGHPLEAVGRRALLLQDAYVHAVVGNPVGLFGAAETYKLGSPGADRGVVSTDGLSAIAGRIGTLPPTTALTARARDLDGGARRTLATRIADEGQVGQPSGTSALGIVATAAVAELATTIARGAPARQSGELCLRVRVRELERRVRTCNRYVVDGSPAGVALAAMEDVASMTGVLESFRFGTLRTEDVELDLGVRAGTALAVMERASAPARVRAGRTVRVRVRVRQVHTGERSTVTVPVRLPRDLSARRHTITLTGAGLDDPGIELAGGFDPVLEDEEDEDREDDGGEGGDALDTLRDVERALARIERYDGVRARVDRGERERVLRDPERRLSGRVQVRVRVTGR